MTPLSLLDLFQLGLVQHDITYNGVTPAWPATLLLNLNITYLLAYNYKIRQLALQD